MRNVKSGALALVFVAVAMVFAAPADAQVRFGVGGGPSFPVGDFGDFFRTGFHVQGDATLGIPLLPLGVRADIAYNRWDEDADPDHHASTFSGTVNGVWNVGFGPVRGYALAGLGIYRAQFDHDDNGIGNGVEDLDDETNFGLNIGVGGQLWLVAVRPFVELRFHHVFSDVESIQFVPLTFGIRF